MKRRHNNNNNTNNAAARKTRAPKTGNGGNVRLHALIMRLHELKALRPSSMQNQMQIYREMRAIEHALQQLLRK